MTLLGTALISGCKDGEKVTESKVNVQIFSAMEGTGGANTIFKVPIVLDKATDQEITVNYQTIDGTAIAGEDFTGGTGSVTLPVRATQGEIQITVISDSTKEGDEDFQLVITSVTGGLSGNNIARVTILNDDNFINLSDEGYTTPTTRPGYTLVWQDEFNGTSLDPAVWTHEIGNSGWGNNELQYYRPENTSVQQGYLIIEAKKETYSGAPYTSSRIISMNKKTFKYGRIDIRAKLPEGKGTWPALWMLGQNINSVSWPACGEIDIMEIIGSEPNKLHGTAHWADANGQRAQYGGSTTLSSGKFVDKFHVFSIVWTSSSIKWYLDDVQFHVIDINPADLNEFKLDFFFIFNVAVGGTWPGNPDGTTVFPQQMFVDYVRVFQ